MLLNKLNSAVLLFISLSALADDVKTIVPPYQIPTFDGKKNEYLKPLLPLQLPPVVPVDKIFNTIVACFPERLQWGIDVNLEAGARESDQAFTGFNSAGISKYYIGIVAKMPLYSATEITTERAKEMQRRESVSTKVGDFVRALSERRRAAREMALYTNLEARAQARVAIGVALDTEQVAYLDKVTAAQSALDIANATIDAARLALVGQCRDEVIDEVNAFLLRVIKQ